MRELRPLVIKLKAADSGTIEAGLDKIKVGFPSAFVGRIQDASDGYFVFINANVEVEPL